MLMEFLSFEMPMVKKSIKAMPSTRQCFLLARPPASRFLQSNQFQCSALAQSVKSATSHSQISSELILFSLKTLNWMHQNQIEEEEEEEVSR